jgi:hypothetical protein
MTGIFEGIRGCDKSSWINTTRERRRWVTSWVYKYVCQWMGIRGKCQVCC